MKTFKIKLNDFNLDIELRCDPKFYDFAALRSYKLINTEARTIKLGDILFPHYQTFQFEEGEEYQGVPTGKDYYDDDGEILDSITITKEDHPDRIKYKVDELDLLISSLKAAKVPPILINKFSSKYVFSNGFYVFKLKNNNWKSKYVLYILRSEKIREIIDNHLCRGIGISTYTERDLLRIRIPIVSAESQEDAITKIKPLEEKINQEKSKLVPASKIIQTGILGPNPFDVKKYSLLEKVKVFKINLRSVADSTDLRADVNFHHPKYEVIDKYFAQHRSDPLSYHIDRPITLGKSPVYDNSGEAYYLTMATIKSYAINIEEAKTISQNFYEENKDSKSMAEKDILMARSGLGTIGKAAIMEKYLPNIYSDFTMRISPADKSTAKWLYYFMRTDLFQLEILRWKKGMGNLMNIYPKQVQKLKIPHIDNKEKVYISDNISRELKELKDKKKKINTYRTDITKIALSYLK